MRFVSLQDASNIYLESPGYVHDFMFADYAQLSDLRSCENNYSALSAHVVKYGKNQR